MQATAEQHTVAISDDGYEAYLVPSVEPEEERLSLEEIQELVKGRGVVFGVDESALQRAASESLSDQGMLIAVGTKPVDGKDGWVEFLYETRETTSEDIKQAKIDFHELHRIHNVLSGQKLALLHPPEAGTPGMKVSGEIVPAREGKKAALRCGQNTSFASADSSCIVSSVDGNAVVHRDGMIEVQPVVTIHGNVDFSTGNQDFVGSLIVTGDVLSDFSIRVKKNLEIHGSVEDAQIEVGGDVIIKKGFVGHGKGKVTAGGNIRLAHVVNQAIVSQKNVIIEKESVAANVTAEGRIIAKRASIVGGVLDAGQGIKVFNLGSSENSRVHAQAGRRKKIIGLLGQVEQEIKQTKQQLTEVRDALSRLVRMKIHAGALPAEKEDALVKLQGVQKELMPRLEALQEERARLSEDLTKNVKAKIIVLDTAFANAVIEINGARKILRETIKEVVFVEHGGAIVEQSI